MELHNSGDSVLELWDIQQGWIPFVDAYLTEATEYKLRYKGNQVDVHMQDIPLPFYQQDRIKESSKIEAIIEEEIGIFNMWLETHEVVPLISRLREKSFTIQEEAVQQIKKKLPTLTEHELNVIRKFSKSIVKQIINEPLIKMKHLVVDNPNKDEMIDIFTQIFLLEDERKEIIQEPTVQQRRSDEKNLHTTINNIPIHS